MRKQTFRIDERLPSRNDMELAARNNKYLANSKKQALQNMIRQYIRKYGIKQVDEPCIIVCTFYENNKRRDSDNVCSSVKYILDAMVAHGTLYNDNPKNVVGAPTFVRYDGSTNSHVEVTIIECDSAEWLQLLLKSSEELLLGVE